MTPHRVSTGIAGLDLWLQGGLVKGQSYLVTGDAGTGKTVLCMQFLLQGLSEGEKGVYVTVDERPAGIMQSAASLGWNFQSHVNEKHLVILDASPYFSGRAGMGVEKGIDLQKIVSDLSGYAKRLEAQRLVIDPITPLILPSDSTTRAQDLARTFIHLIQSQLGTTNLFTAHLPKRAAHNPTFGIEEFLTSGVFVLGMSRIDDRFVRTLTVKKMRGTPIDPIECPFVITHEKGIVLEGYNREKAADQSGASQTLEFFELPKKGN